MNKNIDDIFKIINDLEKTNKEINILIEDLQLKNKLLQLENNTLQDEVNSLWAMMDEITKSDIENFTNILEDLQKDVIVRTLMITKKKALA